MLKSFEPYDWSMAMGALTVLLSLFQPWYLAGSSLKLGASSGLSALVGACLVVAGAAILLSKATDRYVLSLGPYSPEQLSLMLCIAGTLLILVRLAFKPDFGLASQVGVETASTPYIAAAGGVLACFGAFEACRRSRLGLPFRGVLRANSMPSSSTTIASTAATTPTAVAPHAGWFDDPSGRYGTRYFNGVVWTEHVQTGDQQFVDPNF